MLSSQRRNRICPLSFASLRKEVSVHGQEVKAQDLFRRSDPSSCETRPDEETCPEEEARPEERTCPAEGESDGHSSHCCRQPADAAATLSPGGPVDPSETASLTIRLRSSGDTAALEKRVKEQAALPLAQRTYLTHEELAAAHGAKTEDLDLVEKLAHEHDLMVVHRNKAEHTIVLKGKLGDLLSMMVCSAL